VLVVVRDLSLRDRRGRQERAEQVGNQPPLRATPIQRWVVPVALEVSEVLGVPHLLVVAGTLGAPLDLLVLLVVQGVAEVVARGPTTPLKVGLRSLAVRVDRQRHRQQPGHQEHPMLTFLRLGPRRT
jgi:hypothetical protein